MLKNPSSHAPTLKEKWAQVKKKKTLDTTHQRILVWVQTNKENQQ